MIQKTKKLRGILNRILQNCNSESECRDRCRDFQNENGSQVWFAPTGHNDWETFLMVAQEHLNRCILDDGIKDYNETRGKGIFQEIEACSNLQDFKELEAFVHRVKEVGDNWLVMDALQAKGKELDHPDYQEYEGDLPA